MGGCVGALKLNKSLLCDIVSTIQSKIMWYFDYESPSGDYTYKIQS